MIIPPLFLSIVCLTTSLASQEYTIQLVLASKTKTVDSIVETAKAYAIPTSIVPCEDRWFVYSGDFSDRSSARKALQNVRAVFPDAFIRSKPEKREQLSDLNTTLLAAPSELPKEILFKKVKEIKIDTVYIYDCNATGPGITIPAEDHSKHISIRYDCER